MSRVDLTNAEKRRATWERWKAEGRCINCGGRELSAETIKCERCREGARKASRESARRLRDAAFAAYGGPVCACCAVTERSFLTIDHIDGGGNQHRRAIDGARGTNNFYSWLKRNGYPPGFQVLCQNCNVGRWRNGGVCPHVAS